MIPAGIPEQRLNARLNLALAAQQAKPVARSPASSEGGGTRWLPHATLDQRLWWLDLKGRQAIAEGSPGGALQLYDQLADMAREARSIEGGFRAAVGRANAQMTLDRPEEALASFKEADRLIDEQTLHIPASEGRDTFVGQRRVGHTPISPAPPRSRTAAGGLRAGAPGPFAAAAPDRGEGPAGSADARASNGTWDESMSTYWTLHAQVDHEAAQEDLLPGDELKRAMESRAAQLERARKQLDRAMAELGGPGNRDESRLSPPGRGEVILAYHPLPKGWVGFAADAGRNPKSPASSCRTTCSPIPGPPKFREALAPKLIGPFQAVLERAARVRVLPFGPLQSVDFHALPLAGKPLLDSAPRGLWPRRADPASRPRPRADRWPFWSPTPRATCRKRGRNPRSVAADDPGWGQGWTPKLLEGKAAGVARCTTRSPAPASSSLPVTESSRVSPAGTARSGWRPARA